MTSEQEKLEIKLKVAYDLSQEIQREFTNLAIELHLLYGYTTEQIKRICEETNNL